MSSIKKLAGQTAIYGLSSILGRFLNYLLVPLHTMKGVGFEPEQYGVITELYAYVAFLVVLLTYGMETAFFRFVTREGANKAKVFSTAAISLLATSLGFILLMWLFSGQIASGIQYPEHSEYVLWFGLILGFDAITAIPMAQLRVNEKPLHFALVNLANVGVNVGLNVFFLLVLLPSYPEIGVGFVFLANLAGSAVRLLLLLPAFRGLRAGFDPQLLKPMLLYAGPLLIAGFAGIVNETFDRVLLKWLLIPLHGKEYTMEQLGIYGACYKISIVMNLFVQAYRYAAEPFFFNKEKDADSRQVYARLMNVFVAVLCVIFLSVVLFLDVFKYFVPNQAYWPGLAVVPILLLANLCLGLYYSLSAWYKLSGKTSFGAYMTLVGAIITVVLNVLWIPTLGFVGSAWATLACYASIAVLSWFFGQRYYPIPYNVWRVLAYLTGAIGLYLLANALALEGAVMWATHSALLLLFTAVVFRIEKPALKL